MNVDRNMVLYEHGSEYITEDLDDWAGLYSLIESSDFIVRLQLSCTIPEEKDLAVDPDLKGAVSYEIFSLNRRRRRSDQRRYTWYETGGYYMFHENETLADFIKWFRETEGYNVSDKILDYDMKFTGAVLE